MKQIISSKMATAIVLLLMACQFVACSNDEAPELKGSVEMRTISLQVQVNDAVNEDTSNGSRKLRQEVIGDPGLASTFEPPTTLYCIVWCKIPQGGDKVYKQAFKITSASWTPNTTATTDALGHLTYAGGLYSTNLEISLPRSITEGRLLVFAVPEDVTVANFSESESTTKLFYGTEYKEERTLDELEPMTQNNVPTTEEALKALTYTIPEDKFTDGASRSTSVAGAAGAAGHASDFLRNVFCTPYATTDNNIAGRDASRVVLYHNAARLDINWEVAEDKRNKGNSWVKSFTVKNLKSTGISCFFPASVAPTGGNYTETIETDQGSRYVHRQYIYVAQEGSADFPLSYTVTSGTDKAVNGTKSLPTNSEDYTSWYRYLITLN